MTRRLSLTLFAGRIIPQLLPVTLDATSVPQAVPQEMPADKSETLNITCEITFRHGTLRLNGAVSESLLTMLIRELKP